VSVVVPAPESAHHSDIDLSDAALPIGMPVEAAVYKIVEEALTNVMRHVSAPGQGTVVEATLSIPEGRR